jgi:hypothetical protein
MWLCKANALLQLPCGAEFELNVDALYMSFDKLPKSRDKGQSHYVLFYYNFYFVGY